MDKSFRTFDPVRDLVTRVIDRRDIRDHPTLLKHCGDFDSEKESAIEGRTSVRLMFERNRLVASSLVGVAHHEIWFYVRAIHAERLHVARGCSTSTQSHRRSAARDIALAEER